MNDNKTPHPDSENYDVEKPQDLNVPKFNSSTDKRTSEETPATENLNDKKPLDQDEGPDTDLGNDRDHNEDTKERIIDK
jgi:hypothetical protein